MNAPDASEWEELGCTARSLPDTLRRRAADAWARAALAEHASIASFSRFALDLLAAGAPPELVEGAHRAALDEVRHAELSFRVASSYGGVPLGPGPLPIDAGAVGPFSLETLAERTAEEGCVGETLAALEARAARDAAEPAAVRRVLDIIARDESEHAALAFRTLSWALAAGGERVRAVARSAFENAVRSCRSEPVQEGVFESELRAHGRLPARERHELRLKALGETIEPAVAELFAG